VIIVDEIGTSSEAESARTIAQRGVSLVATAHGMSLSSLLKNPTLVKLIGGVHAVTVSDAMALSLSSSSSSSARDPHTSGNKQAIPRKDGGFKKTVLERAGAPTFDMLVELVGYNHWCVYRDVATTVDSVLAGNEVLVETRWINDQGQMMACFENLAPDKSEVCVSFFFSLLALCH